MATSAHQHADSVVSDSVANTSGDISHRVVNRAPSKSWPHIRRECRGNGLHQTLRRMSRFGVRVPQVDGVRVAARLRGDQATYAGDQSRISTHTHNLQRFDNPSVHATGAGELSATYAANSPRLRHAFELASVVPATYFDSVSDLRDYGVT